MARLVAIIRDERVVIEDELKHSMAVWLMYGRLINFAATDTDATIVDADWLKITPSVEEVVLAIEFDNGDDALTYTLNNHCRVMVVNDANGWGWRE